MASPSIPLFAQRQDSISAQRLLPPSELQDERSSPDLKKELKEAATHFEACKFGGTVQLDDWLELLLSTFKELAAYRNLYMLCEEWDGKDSSGKEGTRQDVLDYLMRGLYVNKEAERVILNQYLLVLEKANACPELTKLIRVTLYRLALLKSKINTYSLQAEWLANTPNRVQYCAQQKMQAAKEAAFIPAGSALPPRFCEEGYKNLHLDSWTSTLRGRGEREAVADFKRQSNGASAQSRMEETISVACNRSSRLSIKKAAAVTPLQSEILLSAVRARMGRSVHDKSNSLNVTSSTERAAVRGRTTPELRRRDIFRRRDSAPIEPFSSKQSPEVIDTGLSGGETSWKRDRHLLEPRTRQETRGMVSTHLKQSAPAVAHIAQTDKEDPGHDRSKAGCSTASARNKHSGLVNASTPSHSASVKNTRKNRIGCDAGVANSYTSRLLDTLCANIEEGVVASSAGGGAGVPASKVSAAGSAVASLAGLSISEVAAGNGDGSTSRTQQGSTVAESAIVSSSSASIQSGVKSSILPTDGTQGTDDSIPKPPSVTTESTNSDLSDSVRSVATSDASRSLSGASSFTGRTSSLTTPGGGSASSFNDSMRIRRNMRPVPQLLPYPRSEWYEGGGRGGPVRWQRQ